MKTRLARIAVFVLVIVVLAIVPLAGAQEGPNVTIDLTPYEGNPILTVGEAGAWDDGAMYGPAIVFQDGQYHMFYTGARVGWAGSTFSIGYATSTDGLVWEKSSANPIFEADGSGFDTAAVGVGVVFVEEGTWILYYVGERWFGGPNGSGIGRATAPSPDGPWTREEEPVLLPGSADNEWDAQGVVPASVISTDAGYVMYYFGGNFVSENNNMLGMATSLDGIHWTKYDDPATTKAPYAESDPVLQPGLEGWTMYTLYGGSVLPTTDGWEMFYSEKGWSADELQISYRLGYAASEDGIHWTKYAGFPILSYEDDPAAPSSGHLYSPKAILNDSIYFLYYSYHWSDGGGIGLATGTITRK